MDVSSLDNGTVSLHPDKISVKQKRDMAIFLIIDWCLRYKEDGKGIKMEIIFKRKITCEMLTTYFPTLLLIAITFATTFFKPVFFEAALSVNLTTMLVMTTIFISKMESLPPTSDIKMIDIWLVFCQLVPFTEVVLLTAIEYKRDEKTKARIKKGKKKKDKNTKTTCITVVPKEEDESIQETNDNGEVKKGCYHLLWKFKLPNLKTIGTYMSSASQ